MNVRQRYDNAREAARSGRYEEALRGYIWFHNHALEEDPSYWYGVRLSYALSEWIALASIYPPALARLKRIRDEKAERLARGDGDYALFHDVAAINEKLGEISSTYDVFVKLQKANPALAEKCAVIAMPAIVQVDDFVLARRLIKDPEYSISCWSCELNEAIADDEKRVLEHPSIKKASVESYVKRVRMLLAVLAGVGEYVLADSIRESALVAVESQAVREAVKTGLFPK